MTTKIHSTAIVHSNAELAHDVEIGPYCVIGENVKIGPATKLMSHVVIDGHTTIGSKNIFFPFSVIGAVPQDLKYKGEPTELTIGDHNTIRESVTLNLGTVQGGGKTQLGSHNLLMAYTHLGHDAQVGNYCVLANSVAIAGHVIIEDHVTIGGLVGVVQFVRLGKHLYVGGGAMVDKDALPFSVLIGARPCELKSANLVGLRRSGFKNDEIKAISEAIKIWKQSELQKEECLIKIENEFGNFEHVQYLINFIRKSENGCLR